MPVYDPNRIKSLLNTQSNAFFEQFFHILADWYLKTTEKKNEKKVNHMPIKNMF